jgi:hypothetical protein
MMYDITFTPPVTGEQLAREGKLVAIVFDDCEVWEWNNILWYASGPFIGPVAFNEQYTVLLPKGLLWPKGALS